MFIQFGIGFSVSSSSSSAWTECGFHICAKCSAISGFIENPFILFCDIECVYEIRDESDKASMIFRFESPIHCIENSVIRPFIPNIYILFNKNPFLETCIIDSLSVSLSVMQYALNFRI